MINPKLHEQFNAILTDIRQLVDRVDAEGREPSAEDVQRYSLLVVRAEELRRNCLPIPQLNLSQIA